MSLRDYGLGNPGTPVGKPSWKISNPPVECPNCGAITCDIQVDMEAGTDPVTHLAMNMMGIKKGERGVCTYMGCPACPWASPAMLTRKEDLK